MKKGFILVAFMALATALFAGPTTLTATQNGDKVDVTITWTPADPYAAVELRGDYEAGTDRWASGIPMTKSGTSWTITLAGRKADEQFQYKYYADGEWQDAEENYPGNVGNPFGGVNGLAVVADVLAGKFAAGVAAAPAGDGTKLYWNVYQPVGLIYGQSDLKNENTAYANLAFKNYMKIHGTLPFGVKFFTELKLADKGDYNLWAKGDSSDANNAKLLKLMEIPFRGYTVFNDQWTDMIKFMLSYETDIGTITWSDHYYKPLAESDGAPFYYQVYGVDATKDANSLMGAIQLAKKGLKVADGIKLDYMVTLSERARSSYDLPIWGSAADGWTGTGGSWDMGKRAYKGMQSYVRADLGDITAGLMYNNVSEAFPNAFDDFFSTLNNEIGLGVKGSAGVVSSYAAEALIHSFYRSTITWKAGDFTALGAKATLNFDPVTVGVDFRAVGQDFDNSRFYQPGEDGQGVKAMDDKGYMKVTIDPKFSSGGITVGLESVFKTKNFLVDNASFDKNSYLNEKLYGGYSAGDLSVNGYAKLKYTMYETTPTGTTAAEFTTFGADVTAKNVVPGLLDSLTFRFADKFYGTATEASGDNSSTLHFLVDAMMMDGISAGVGVAVASGDAVANNDKNFGLGFKLAKKLADKGWADPQEVFLQVHNGIDMFDGDDKSAYKLDDNSFDKAGQNLSNSLKILLGVTWDF